MINVKFTSHFIARMRERCEFVDEKTDIYGFLANNYTSGIICHPLDKPIAYLGLPGLNARIPLKKTDSSNYISLTYTKGVVYIGYAVPCIINWSYDKDLALDKIVSNLDTFDSCELE